MAQLAASAGDALPVKSRTSELLTIAGAAALIWLIKWLVWGLAPLSGDGDMYVSMASGGAGHPPYSFHILSPRLAGFLFPANPILGFFWIAAVSFVGTAVTMDLLLRKVGLGITKAERALGVGLFMATCTGANMFRAYYMTDSVSYFLLAVACAATLYRRDAIVALVTVIGIFNRETAAFIIPVWIIANLGAASIASLLQRFILAFSPAVAAYLVLQHTPYVLGFEPTHLNYLNFQNMLMLWRITLSWLGTENIYYGLAICVFLAYGPVWFMAARGVREAFTRLPWQELQPLVALWGLALPVAATLMIVDWRRGFQPLFPAITTSAVLGIRALTSNRPAYCWGLMAAATTLAAAATSDAWWSQPMRTPVIIAMGPWLAILAFVLTRPRGPARS